VKTPDWRVTRARARELVLRTDAFRRSFAPIFRDRPPLTAEDIARELTRAAAANAFWIDDQTPRDTGVSLAHATRAQIVGYCVEYVHEDVCNGGFHQLFMNGTGDFAQVVVRALRAMGELERAQLFVEAMARFPGGVAPVSRVTRQAALERIPFQTDWEPWIEPIERAYFALPSDALRPLVDHYLDTHPRELFLDD
jgi:hypothetical protein